MQLWEGEAPAEAADYGRPGSNRPNPSSPSPAPLRMAVQMADTGHLETLGRQLGCLNLQRGAHDSEEIRGGGQLGGGLEHLYFLAEPDDVRPGE